MIYEHWQSVDKSDNHIFPQDALHVGTLYQTGVKCCEIVADDWNDAMVQFHWHMGWEPYKPMDEEPHPKLYLVDVEIATIDGAEMPQYHSERAVGFDLACNVDFTIRPGSVERVPTGIIVKPADGHYAQVVARSSLHKLGLLLVNGIGIVDPDYCGPTDQIHLPLLNFTENKIAVARGTRLAQVVLAKHYRAVLHPFEPSGKDRGGLGSTGQ